MWRVDFFLNCKRDFTFIRDMRVHYFNFDYRNHSNFRASDTIEPIGPSKFIQKNQDWLFGLMN